MREEADDVVALSLGFAELGDVGEGQDHADVALFAVYEGGCAHQVAADGVGEIDLYGAGAAVA
jgi:hypothetical protein